MIVFIPYNAPIPAIQKILLLILLVLSVNSAATLSGPFESLFSVRANINNINIPTNKAIPSGSTTVCNSAKIREIIVTEIAMIPFLIVYWYATAIAEKAADCKNQL